MMQENNLRLTCRYGLRYDSVEMTVQINIVFQYYAALYILAIIISYIRIWLMAQPTSPRLKS